MVLLLDNAEVVLANTAEGAYPVVWNILESCSRLDAAVRIAYFRVIDITAYITYILLHNDSVFFSLIIFVL